MSFREQKGFKGLRQEQHFCPGFSTSVQGECVVQLIFTDPSSGGSYAFIVQQLLFQSISFFAGVDIETVVFNLVPRGSLFEASCFTVE